MKILICDDDPALVSLIRFQLQDENIGELFIATNGEQAMKLADDHAFDLLITDIHMPYYNGDDVMHLLKKKSKGQVKVIMMSADDEEEVKNLAKKQGVLHFFSKPFDVGVLVKIVKRLLSP